VTLSEPVDDPIAFQRFVEFLYCGNYEYTAENPLTGLQTRGIPAFGYVNSKSGNLDLSTIIATLPVHAKCYALGERLMAPGFKQVALSKLKSSLHALFAFTSTPEMVHTWASYIVDTVRIIYENTHRPYSSRDESQREEKAQMATPIPSGARVLAYPYGKGGPYSAVQQLIDTNDPARQALANFCAVRVEVLRIKEEFRSLVRDWGEFAEDLLLEVGGAGGLRG